MNIELFIAANTPGEDVDLPEVVFEDALAGLLGLKPLRELNKKYFKWFKNTGDQFSIDPIENPKLYYSHHKLKPTPVDVKKKALFGLAVDVKNEDGFFIIDPDAAYFNFVPIEDILDIIEECQYAVDLDGSFSSSDAAPKDNTYEGLKSSGDSFLKSAGLDKFEAASKKAEAAIKEKIEEIVASPDYFVVEGVIRKIDSIMDETRAEAKSFHANFIKSLKRKIMKNSVAANKAESDSFNGFSSLEEKRMKTYSAEVYKMIGLDYSPVKFVCNRVLENKVAAGMYLPGSNSIIVMEYAINNKLKGTVFHEMGHMIEFKKGYRDQAVQFLEDQGERVKPDQYEGNFPRYLGKLYIIENTGSIYATEVISCLLEFLSDPSGLTFLSTRMPAGMNFIAGVLRK